MQNPWSVSLWGWVAAYGRSSLRCAAMLKQPAWGLRTVGGEPTTDALQDIFGDADCYCQTWCLGVGAPHGLAQVVATIRAVSKRGFNQEIERFAVYSFPRNH